MADKGNDDPRVITAIASTARTGVTFVTEPAGLASRIRLTWVGRLGFA